jgi:hypothetical protein
MDAKAPAMLETLRGRKCSVFRPKNYLERGLDTEADPVAIVLVALCIRIGSREVIRTVDVEIFHRTIARSDVDIEDRLLKVAWPSSVIFVVVREHRVGAAKEIHGRRKLIGQLRADPESGAVVV